MVPEYIPGAVFAGIDTFKVLPVLTKLWVVEPTSVRLFQSME
jgi:hypothetical protein